jgi:hypothetical protein
MHIVQKDTIENLTVSKKTKKIIINVNVKNEQKGN